MVEGYKRLYAGAYAPADYVEAVRGMIVDAAAALRHSGRANGSTRAVQRRARAGTKSRLRAGGLRVATQTPFECELSRLRRRRQRDTRRRRRG